ncbi:hypothetical protein AWB76_00950 [Caballeronia temeraria]|uniref:Uncharacterized protein n=1 Tax=Caballeronia temeraria TaxID=1777137 RepID=A0A157ZMB4_9BURK|nr:hypothetical protein [Caballeronia temeraria]SAK46655.1 hypothetical protein AWB76_00950 [Caballeronia temeraria]
MSNELRWRCLPAERKNGVSMWECKSVLRPDDIAKITAFRLYAQEVFDWFSERYPKKRRLPMFTREESKLYTFDFKRQQYQPSDYIHVYHILLDVKGDADNIDFRFKFAPDGYETIGEKQC